MKWNIAGNTQYYVKNRITFGRIWPTDSGEWQIAVNLPDAFVEYHKFKTARQAKKAVVDAVELWFRDVQ